jgi:hypothetical protein
MSVTAPPTPLAAPAGAIPPPAAPLASPTAPALPGASGAPAAPGAPPQVSPLIAAVKAKLADPAFQKLSPEARRAALMGVVKPAPLGGPQGAAALHPVQSAIGGGVDPKVAIEQHVFGDNP